MLDEKHIAMTAMENFLRGRTESLDVMQRALLERAIGETRRVPARTTLVERGETLRQSTMLVSGFMTRFIDDLDGHRQIVAFHVPGDFVDLHGFPLHRLDHGIATVSPIEIALVPHREIDRILRDEPELARKLWFSTLLDAAMHREWLFRLGRLDAVGRVAHFFAETDARLRPIGLSEAGRYALPITQTDLADICGLTPIHVNRVLRVLREEAICTFRSGAVEIRDRARLVRRAQFDPTYLYLRGGDDAGPSAERRNVDDG